MISNAADETVLSLSTVPAFAGLAPALLEAVAQAAIARDFAAGQVVFLQGEPCAGLYIVHSGWLRSLMISPTGRQQVVRLVGAGESFNELSVFAGGVNKVTVEALEPSHVWIVPRDLLLRLLDQHPALGRVIIQNMAHRIQHLMSLVEDLSLLSVEARLARLLLKQASGDVILRRRWATQAEMASRLGTVPDVLNRALRSLVDEELIALDRHQIQILNRSGLEAKAQFGE